MIELETVSLDLDGLVKDRSSVFCSGNATSFLGGFLLCCLFFTTAIIALLLLGDCFAETYAEC